MYRRSDPEGPRGSNLLSSCLLYPITRQFRPVRSRWFAGDCPLDGIYELRTSVSPFPLRTRGEFQNGLMPKRVLGRRIDRPPGRPLRCGMEERATDPRVLTGREPALAVVQLVPVPVRMLR